VRLTTRDRAFLTALVTRMAQNIDLIGLRLTLVMACAKFMQAAHGMQPMLARIVLVQPCKCSDCFLSCVLG